MIEHAQLRRRESTQNLTLHFWAVVEYAPSFPDRYRRTFRCTTGRNLNRT